VDGRPVENFAELVDVLDAHEFGDRVTLTVRRSEQSVDVPVTLGSAETGSRAQ
jgi:S1-C subfamily serine protease